jgi:hypothetical membrane protein
MKIVSSDLSAVQPSGSVKVRNWAEPPISRDWLTRALLLCGIAAPLVLAVFVVAVAEITPGSSPVTNTVSHFSAQGAPHGELMAGGLVVIGLMIDAFACGLARVVERAFAWIGLWILGTALALSGIARNYSPDAPRNVEGFLHNVFGIVAGIGLALSMAGIAHAAHKTPGWQSLTAWSIAGAILVLLGCLVFFRLPQSDHGVVERMVYLFATVWFFAVSVTALRAGPRTSSRR